MHPDKINDHLAWRGLKLRDDTYVNDTQPYTVRVVFEEGANVKGETWEQLNAAVTLTEIILLAYEETRAGLWVCVIPLTWVTDRLQSWYQLNRYVGFMTFPYEKETRPDDPLAISYPVIQQDPIFLNGSNNVQNIYVALKLLDRLAHGQDKVFSPLEGSAIISGLLTFEAMDRMMIFCIKQLPEYSGSKLEQIGEPLWLEWQGLMKQLTV